jgi:hypothetical protein
MAVTFFPEYKTKWFFVICRLIPVVGFPLQQLICIYSKRIQRLVNEVRKIARNASENVCTLPEYTSLPFPFITSGTV